MKAVRRGLCLLPLLSSCGQTLDLGSNDFDFTLSATPVVLPQDGVATQLTVTLRRDATNQAINVLLHGFPQSAVAAHMPMRTGDQVLLPLTTTPDTPPRDYQGTVEVTAGTGGPSVSHELTVTVAPVAKVDSSIDMSQGVGGTLEEFMSTSFQPASWQERIPDETALAMLMPQHVHVQVYDPPWKASSDPQQDSDWDFGLLDTFLDKLLASGDASPVLQIDRAPPLPKLVDGSGNIVSTDPATWPDNVATFATYCEDLVRYYNTPEGFLWNGKPRKSNAGHPITWWGIFGDSNLFLDPTKYADLYKAAVTRMHAVDPSIRFSAVEFTDFASGNTDMGKPATYFPQFIASLGGSTPPPDVLSVHFYSAHYRTDLDATLFATIPPFASDVASLSNHGVTPVWLTQNNVDSDVPVLNPDGKYYSSQAPTLLYENDPRGTSAFFTAWRPYLFSLLGKAGNRALYHWDYTAGQGMGPSLDMQNAEVDYTTGAKYSAYWVDYWLRRMFPATDSGGPAILTLTRTDSTSPPTVEVLATRNTDGSVVVMVVDIAVHDPSKDVNGSGDPRTVVVDLSALGQFTRASTLTIDGSVDLVNGPKASPTAIPPDRRVPVTLNGYGVAFLTLTP